MKKRGQKKGAENTNCLKNVRCPQCGATDKFVFRTQARVTLTDEGVVDTVLDLEFHETETIVECVVCQKVGPRVEFFPGQGLFVDIVALKTPGLLLATLRLGKRRLCLELVEVKGQSGPKAIKAVNHELQRKIDSVVAADERENKVYAAFYYNGSHYFTVSSKLQK